jgi:quercetin dioxygenase-like cupin family protein
MGPGGPCSVCGCGIVSLHQFKEGHKTMKKLTSRVAVLAALVCGPAAFAQAPEPLKRTVFQKIDYPGDKITTLLVLIEGAPNFVVVKNTHPGVEMGMILEGAVEFTIGNQPPKTFKVGETFMILAYIEHTIKFGANGAKAIVTFVVEKDKPLTTAVP